MGGVGTIDLPAQTINFRVDPQVAASLEGQGGKKDLEGLGVPVAINGPWAQPSIYPDIAGILENPQAAYEKLSKLGGGLVKLPGADSLGGAFGRTGGIAGLVKGKAGELDRGSDQSRPRLPGTKCGARIEDSSLAPIRLLRPRLLPPNLPRLQPKSPPRRRASRSRPRRQAQLRTGRQPPAQPAAVAPAKPGPRNSSCKISPAAL